MMLSINDNGVRRCLIILIFIHVCCLWAVSGFSDGSKLATGSATTRALYCNRKPNLRDPLHFDHNCKGYCAPRRDFEQFYTLTVSNTTYWLDVVRVNISAKPGSGKSVTGFSLYAIGESDHVAGSFVEDDTNVVVGTCNDLIAVTDETHAAFHKMADHGRKNISIQWQPDGYNHGRVKFVLWVVNNHSDAYFMESQFLTSQKDGSNTLDIRTTLDNIVSAIDIDVFENSFKYRSTKGYNLDLANPFSAFDRSPSKNDFVPANITSSNGGSNAVSGNSSLVISQPGGSGTNASSTSEVSASNATSGMHDGSVLGNRNINTTKVNDVNNAIMLNASENKLNTVNDTKLNHLTETNMDTLNDTNLNTMNQTTMGNVNDTNLNNMNQTNMSNVNDTNLNNMNQTNMSNVNDTNLNNMNQTNMSNVNDTNLNNMNQTNMSNVNDTNLNNMNQTNMSNVNDTNLNNMNQTNMSNVNDTNLNNMNQTNMSNVNDTNLYTMNQTNMANMNDTNLNTMNQTTMSNVNDTNLNNMNQTNMSNVNDTNLYTMNQTNMANMNDTNLNTMNQTTMGNVNDTNRFNMNQINTGNVNDTNLYTVNQTTMGNVNDTNLNTVDQTNMGIVNDTSRYDMNQTNMGNVNDTNPYTVKQTNMNNINDAIVKNLTLTPASSGSQTTQLDSTTNQNIPNPSQIPVIGTSGSQLEEPSNNVSVNAAITPITTTSYPQLRDSQTTALGNSNMYTTTIPVPDPKPRGSLDVAAPGNKRILNTSGNTNDVTPAPGPNVSNRAVTAGNGGFSTSAYPDSPANKRADLSTMSRQTSESPSSTIADDFRPVAV